MWPWRAARALLLACVICGPALALDEGKDAELETVRDRVQKLLPEVGRENVHRAAAPGLFEIQRGMAFSYVMADARYLLRGDLIDLQSGLVLTEVSRRAARAQVLRGLAEHAIAFEPPAGRTRHTVVIFIDVDCHYCRALHREVPAMNAQGIAVRYLFYPREGERSPAFEHAQNVYCAPDPRAALDTVFSGHSLEKPSSDCENPVAEQYASALALGVKGTPMMVLPDGRIVYGEIGANALTEMLEKPELTGPATAVAR